MLLGAFSLYNAGQVHERAQRTRLTLEATNGLDRSQVQVAELLRTLEAGGGTRFCVPGKIIRPEAGKLLAWNNRRADGSPNPATLHQGMKVRKGTKYVLTKWFREQPFA